jgi:hypothetical protein
VASTLVKYISLLSGAKKINIPNLFDHLCTSGGILLYIHTKSIFPPVDDDAADVFCENC